MTVGEHNNYYEPLLMVCLETSQGQIKKCFSCKPSFIVFSETIVVQDFMCYQFLVGEYGHTVFVIMFSDVSGKHVNGEHMTSINQAFVV